MLKAILNPIVIFTTVFLYCYPALSQQPYVKIIGVPEGVPSINIYDLYVAKNGLLYLGTDKGLFSFDGVNFKKIEFTESLAVGVNGIIEDDKGRIWCKNFSSQIFYTQDNQLILEPNSSKLMNQSDINLNDFQIQKENLYLATDAFVVRIDLVHGNVKYLFQLSTSVGAASITSVAIDEKTESTYIGTTHEIIHLNKTGKILKFPTSNGKSEFAQYQGETYYILRDTHNEIRDLQNRQFIPKNQEKLGYFIALSEANKELWLCTTRGVFRVNTVNKTIGSSFLENIKATDIVSDLEGNLWVSTIGSGLYFIPNERLISVELPQKKSNLTCLSKDSQGNVFVGSSDGRVYQINKSNQFVFEYDCSEDKEIEFIHTKGNFIYTSRGIFEKKKVELLYRYYIGKDIAEDDLGNFIIGSYNLSGIVSQELGKSPQLPDFLVGKLKSATYSELKQHIFILKNKRTRAVHFDRNTKSYYTGNSDGLFIYSKAFKKTEILDKNNHPIIASHIQGDEDGNVWVASIQQGLYKINGDKVVDHLNTTNGLPNNQCKKMRIDKNEIWLITDAGLHLINRKDMKIYNISAAAGLNGLMINDIEIANNNIYLATNDGLLTASTVRITEQVQPHFKIKSAEHQFGKFEEGSELNHKQNTITFGLETIYYRSLGNYNYEYRLIGVHEAWQTQSSRVQEVNFMSLEPGKYVFEARINSGDYYSPIERFEFNIALPFWKTYWFNMLVIFLVLLTFYMIFNWQIDKIKKRQNVKEQLALSQITALRAQMNPHFMFNILNAFQGLIYTNQKTKANEYLGVFSDLMRKTLDISDQKEISIYEELEAVELYVELEKARFDTADNEHKGLVFIVEAPPNDTLKNFMIPPLILQPYIENAVKHGLLHKEGEKLLTLRIVRENEKYWRFEIEDNGIGREQSLARNRKFQKHKSFATQAIDTRIELINKLNILPITLEIIDLKNELNQPKGTLILLRIPVKSK